MSLPSGDTARTDTNPFRHPPMATGKDGDDTVTAEVCNEADIGDGE